MEAPRARNAAIKRWAFMAARIAFMVVPLVWIGATVHWRSVAARAVALGLRPIAASFAIGMSSMVFSAARWRVLLRAYGVEKPPKLLTMLRHALVGLYFGLMPGGVAGDAVRGYRLRAEVGDLGTSYAVLVVERALGLAALLALATVSLMLPGKALGGFGYVFAFVSAIGVVLAGIAVWVPMLTEKNASLRATLARLPIVGRAISSVRPPRKLRDIVVAFFLSLCTQSSAIGAMIVLIDPHASLSLELRVAPLVVLLTFVPITPGGIGQRELAFKELFGLAGVAPATAIAASALTFAIGLSIAGIGALCVLWERTLAAEAR